jgi:hypothetical protein
MLARLSLNEKQCKLLSIGFALGLAKRLVDGLAHHRRCQRDQLNALSTDRTAFGDHPTTEARGTRTETNAPATCLTRAVGAFLANAQQTAMPLSWTPLLISLEHVHAEAHAALPERSPAPHLLAASTHTGTRQRRGRAQYLCVDVAVSDKLAQQPGVLIKDAVAFPGLAESLPSGTLST